MSRFILLIFYEVSEDFLECGDLNSPIACYSTYIKNQSKKNTPIRTYVGVLVTCYGTGTTGIVLSLEYRSKKR